MHLVLGFYFYSNQASSFISFHVCTLLLCPIQMLCILDSDKAKASRWNATREREKERQIKTTESSLKNKYGLMCTVHSTRLRKCGGNEWNKTCSNRWTAMVSFFHGQYAAVFRLHASYCVQYVCVLCGAHLKTITVYCVVCVCACANGYVSFTLLLHLACNYWLFIYHFVAFRLWSGIAFFSPSFFTKQLRSLGNSERATSKNSQIIVMLSVGLR